MQKHCDETTGHEAPWQDHARKIATIGKLGRPLSLPAKSCDHETSDRPRPDAPLGRLGVMPRHQSYSLSNSCFAYASARQSHVSLFPVGLQHSREPRRAQVKKMEPARGGRAASRRWIMELSTRSSGGPSANTHAHAAQGVKRRLAVQGARWLAGRRAAHGGGLLIWRTATRVPTPMGGWPCGTRRGVSAPAGCARAVRARSALA